jgi:YHS domain-containing protein
MFAFDKIEFNRTLTKTCEHIQKYINNYKNYLSLSMPVDPVCGIEMDEGLAISFEYNNKKYYFCCEGCKGIFKRKPKKYNNS